MELEPDPVALGSASSSTEATGTVLLAPVRMDCRQQSAFPSKWGRRGFQDLGLYLLISPAGPRHCHIQHGSFIASESMWHETSTAWTDTQPFDIRMSETA